MKSISKKHLFLTLLLLSGFITFSQPNFFKNIGFDEALRMAKSTKQIIFIQLDTNCDECNEVALKGLAGKGIPEIYEKFICIKISANSEDFNIVSKKYRISPIYPTSLFLNSDGDFITMMYDKSTSNSMEYIKISANAMAMQKNPPLQHFNQKYSSGNRNPEFLKAYLLELQKYNFDNDDILESFVGQLKVDSLLSKNNLLFIMKCTPIIGSKTDKLMRFDEELFHETFMALPFPERKKMNNLIIAKSRKKAYFEKDVNYMRQVANFVQGTYEKRDDGRRAYNINIIDFYKEIKDTTNYINNAKSFYQWEFEKINIDSIAKVELEKTIEIEPGKYIKGGKLLTTGNQINKMAWAIYEFTDDLELLAKILNWSERTLVYENPAFHDTYSHILYKMGNREKAIEFQQKAVELAQKKYYPDKELIEELNKMKVGVL